MHVDFLPFMHCFINPGLQSLMATSTCSSRPLSNKSSLGSYKCFLPFIKIPNVVCAYSLILQELCFPYFNTSRCKCMVKPFYHVQTDRSLKGYACLVGKYSGVLASYLFSLSWCPNYTTKAIQSGLLSYCRQTPTGAQRTSWWLYIFSIWAVGFSTTNSEIEYGRGVLLGAITVSLFCFKQQMWLRLHTPSEHKVFGIFS